MRFALVVGIAVALLLFAVGPSRPAAPTDTSDAAFARSLVAAINSKGVARRLALVHSKSLSCVHADGDSIFSDMFARQMKRRVPADFKWMITAVKQDEPALFSDLFDYPVPPTHRLQLDFTTGPSSSTSLIVQVAREGSRWREVLGCPKPEAIVAMRAARQARRAESDRARLLAGRVPPALRDSLLKLFAKGRRADAYRRYMESSGENLATAKEVVDVLADKAKLPR